MSFKFLSLTLAGALSMQSMAIAQTDRTAGIGDEQIRAAKQNIMAVKKDLLALDQALIAAKENIEKRDSSGRILNGSAIAGAAVGLGLSAIAGFSFSSRGGSSSGILGFFAGAAAVLTSASSSGLSAAGEKAKPDSDLKDLTEKLNGAEAEVQGALSATSDKATVALLKQLDGSLKEVRKTLTTYSEKDASISKNKLIAQITQAAGAAITVYGVTQRQSKAVLIGPLIMSAGNIGQIVGGLSDADAELVLKEIENTRRSLLSAAVALE
ncbi:MAG: hypothetical protein KUL82_13585 [Bdellovibrio sp.]|uniref:hypothetical protein n=1 Tax=Bdellovibrio sp. TaxID=28201 RepID=UPI0039E674E2|nr:hypothetical protein [Bdellovibrio sp.]